MSNREFDIEVDIDPNDLLEENLTHASKCQYYGDRLADAILERDQAKTSLKVVEAELYDKLMRTWKTMYQKIPSEPMRNGWVIRQKEYKIAVDKYHKAEHNVNLLKSADKAFDGRGYALGNITSILVSGFASAPKINRGAKKQREQRTEDIKNTKLDLPRKKKLIKKPVRKGN